MPGQNELNKELADLIVSSLSLEGTRPENIDPEARLFGGGLGLDSIDALEIAMVVEKKFGVKLRSDDPNIADIFVSLQALSTYIHDHRVR